MFATHGGFSDEKTRKWADAGCRDASIGCRDCKAALHENLLIELGPLHERRAELAADPDRVTGALSRGAESARKVAGRTMDQVRRAMRIQR